MRVIIGIIEVLNEYGIVPDILTANLRFTDEQVKKQYGRQIKADYHIKPLSRIPGLHGDINLIRFNRRLFHWANDYDLLINTSNSLAFLPPDCKVLSYVFFPRKRRLTANADIHKPDTPVTEWSFYGIQRKLLRRIYGSVKLYPNHEIVCMTKFTEKALRSEYSIKKELPLVYPPVDIEKYQNTQKKKLEQIVTMGRFSEAKRQLEQIKMAQKVPNIDVHIIGFVHDSVYYQQCQRYIDENNINNVHLHADMPFEQVLKMLSESKYFLHSLINEPFGLTAVQAIASGCIPIVHNSGGQKETVTDSRLRYDSLSEVPGILKWAESLNDANKRELVAQMQCHANANFSATVFHKKMKSILHPYFQQ